MLTNYVKIALRNLRRHKGYAFINIFGLAVGIALCALIFLYVQDELTYDRFHEDADRIFRVNTQYFGPDGGVESEVPWQPFPLAEALATDLPEVVHSIRLFERQAFIRSGGGEPTEVQVLYADPGVLEAFTFPLLQGTPQAALANPNSVVLSATAAYRHFGTDDPVGQTLAVRMGDTYHDVQVTGVAADVPANASIRFDYLMPFSKLSDAYDWIRSRADNWRASSFFVYVYLRPEASLAAVQAKMPALRTKYFPDEAKELRAEGQWHSDAPPRTYHLQPLTDIHLNPDVRAGLTPPSDPRYAYILAGIALSILLIACINFMTLAVGRSAGRAREIGVRKVVGAGRRQLMAQFWGEALLLSMLALLLGLALAELFLPVFNTLAGRTLHFDYLGNPGTLAALAALVVAAGLVAGSYPALVLSGIRPIEAFRRRLRLGGANVLTRALIIVQFALSIALVAGTVVMLRQLDYLQTRNLGFDTAQAVVIPTQRMGGPMVVARFRDALQTHPGIEGITAASSAFTRGWNHIGWTYREQPKSAFVYRVESDYLDVMKMELVAGRNFNPALSTDSTAAVLVNEAFVRDFGWDAPLGQRLDGFYDEPVVVGVFKDVNFRSLHQAVAPMVLTLHPDEGLGHLIVRIAPTDVPATLATLRATWNAVAPEVPFKYSFLDEDLGRQYESEARWSRIVAYGAAFAVLIACMGLFGLAALTVAGRTKEVGIRKVMGASVAGVALLLSKDFARLVVIALVVASPVAYLAMQRWLENFAYRIEIGWWTFALAGGLALAVAWLTVSYQAIKAARSNPVDALRYE